MAAASRLRQMRMTKMCPRDRVHPGGTEMTSTAATSQLMIGSVGAQSTVIDPYRRLTSFDANQ
jgi:hypothetical protein